MRHLVDLSAVQERSPYPIKQLLWKGTVVPISGTSRQVGIGISILCVMWLCACTEYVPKGAEGVGQTDDSLSGVEFGKEDTGISGGTQADAGTTTPKETCGNALCDATESCANCPKDCGWCAGCGNGACDGGETTANCPQDCGSKCGDGVCNGPEDPQSCAQDCGDPPPATALNYTCTPVGTSTGDGFFELEPYNGHLYAGQFGYGLESQSMVYRYPEWELTSPGLKNIGESVCAMLEFEGKLYANTENSGDIFVTTDGSNWSKIYDGPNQSIGCGLAEFKGKLYAINYQNGNNTHGRVLRLDGGNWSQVYDSGQDSLYLRDLVSYKGTLYAFGVQDEQGRMLTSTNGSQWTKTAVANRYLRSHVYNGYLWLGSTDMSAPSSTVGIFRFDGTDFLKMYTSSKRYVTKIKDIDGVLFAGTSNGWKNEYGPSSLLMSPDNGESWKTICTFDETAVWDLAVHNNELYLGTWNYGGKGHVVRVVAGNEAPPVIPDDPPAPVVDCSLISSANGAWEVCVKEDHLCAGVYTDGAGCQAYCTAAGMICVARYGGEPGCQKEPEYAIDCDEQNTHKSDWCECGLPAGGKPPITNPDPPILPADCAPKSGSLGAGQTYTLGVDAHSGDEDTTQPKTDANDGKNGDNPKFQRYNVARAHNDYWYTSSFQSTGEPSPAGVQWVDYKPSFSALGVGCYKIVGQYRATSSRANYIVDYKVFNTATGDSVYKEVQKKGEGEYLDIQIGTYQLCNNSYVRIQDPGPKSICFNKMKFIYLGATCQN